MIEVKTKLRRWGNSLGVVIPQEALESANSGEGDEITMFIKTKQKNELSEIFGILKNSKIDAQKFKNEIRDEEKSKSNRCFK